MANEENLIPLNKRTKSEQREITSSGGKASGEARRHKRDMKTLLDFYLSLPVADRRQFNKLSRRGVPVELIDNKMAIAVGLAEAGARGDVAAAKEVVKLIGEATAQKDEVLQKLDAVLEGIDSGI